MTIKVEGRPSKESIHKALLAAYPELTINTQNGNLELSIQTSLKLDSQIKDVKIMDLR